MKFSFKQISVCTILGILSVSLFCTYSNATVKPLKLDKKTYSIKTITQYENPITKELEDLKLKKGQSSYLSKKAIGDGMSRATIGSYALLDNKNTKKNLTIRLGLTHFSSKHQIYVKTTKNNDYKEVKFKEVSHDKKAHTKDFKFDVPSESAYIKVKMYVEPMGRNVIFFSQMDTKNVKLGDKAFKSQEMSKKMKTPKASY